MPAPTTASESLAKDGYVVLPNVLTPAQVDSLRSRVEAVIQAAGSDVAIRAGTQWIRALDLSDYPECSQNQLVLKVTRALLGENPTPTSLTMRNPVSATAQQALHVDWAGPIHPGTDQQLQALFLLDDATDSNGPTRVVPGTHASYSVPDGRFANPQSKHPDQIFITAGAGDVIIFSSHTWHSGTANNSGLPRRTLTLTIRR